MLQQAALRVLMPLYEPDFSSDSYGFRPNRNTHQAVSKALGYINSGFQNIVEIDLKAFFDEVDHTLLMQLIYRKVKCRETLLLLKRWLRAPIEIEGKLVKRKIKRSESRRPLKIKLFLSKRSTTRKSHKSVSI
jgi:retron-type reverse transcriptase